MYKIGFGRADITPVESMPLSGMGLNHKRFSRAIRDELYATCIAITDEHDTTILMYTLDLQDSHFAIQVRPQIAELTGVPETNIFMSGTHTHSGPHVGNRDFDCCARYRQMLTEKLKEAAVQALEDREPARLFMGQVETERMNFVKHYYNVENGEKKFFGDNFGTQVLDETTRHATEADPTMHILKAVRPGKKDIVLVNWRAHPHCTSGTRVFDVSADLIGDFREFAEKEGVLFAFYQGAAGNINNKTRIEDERVTANCRAQGRCMAQFLKKGLENLTELTCGPIKVTRTVLTLPLNKPTAEQMVYVDRVRACWQETMDFKLSIAQGAEIGMRSPYQANAMYGRYHDPAETEDSELNAVSFGEELAFVTAPNELFDTISVYVEDHAPYKKVLTLGYCNGYTGYIPSKYGFEYTCYESDCCHFKPGCGEIYQDTFLKMLNELKG